MLENNGTPYTPLADFSLEEDYKPEPLIPKGNYLANIVSHPFNRENGTLRIEVVFAGNDDVVLSDGESTLDGRHETYTVWLPKRGDEDNLTKDGKMTKLQFKINALREFFDAMKIPIKTVDSWEKIAQSCDNGDWVGYNVLASVAPNEYQGRVRNQINKLVAAPNE